MEWNKKDMKISIYTTSGFPFGNAAENFVRTMSEGLSNCKQDLRIYTIKGNTTDNKASGHYFDIAYRTLFFKYRPSNEIIKLLQLIIIILLTPFHVFYSKVINKTDVIVLYGIEYAHFTIPFLITSKILRIKIIRIITDDYPVTTIVPQWWKALKLLSYKSQYKYIDKKLTGIVCLSHYLYNKCLKFGVRKDHLKLIPHFIKPKLFNLSKIKSSNESGGLIRIGYCGAVNENNGIIDLLKAFRLVNLKLSNSELLIIGDLSLLLRNLREHINYIKKDLKDRVIFTGKRDTRVIPDLLHSCDILVNPRRKSTFAKAGFPTKIGEYFASKRAVVATRVGDISLYFDEQKELLLAEPNNPQSIADCILRLIQSPEKRKELSKQGYNWMLKNLDYIKSSKKLITFIKKI